jgi:hypothetical protein
VFCAGSDKTGFVKESKLNFQSKGKQVNSDYHSEIYADIFTDCSQIISLII